MKEVNVIYWSSTGNTQAMAEAVGAGVEEAGGKANVMEVSAADVSMLRMQTASRWVLPLWAMRNWMQRWMIS